MIAFVRHGDTCFALYSSGRLEMSKRGGHWQTVPGAMNDWPDVRAKKGQGR